MGTQEGVSEEEPCSDVTGLLPTFQPPALLPSILTWASMPCVPEDGSCGALGLGSCIERPGL